MSINPYIMTELAKQSHPLLILLLHNNIVLLIPRKIELQQLPEYEYGHISEQQEVQDEHVDGVQDEFVEAQALHGIFGGSFVLDEDDQEPARNEEEVGDEGTQQAGFYGAAVPV